MDFLNWVITSDEGRDSMANVMGFTTPFDTFADGYVADNVFIQTDAAYTAAGKYPVTWCFTTMPSENWKNGVGSALLEYAQEPVTGQVLRAHSLMDGLPSTMQ